MGRYVTEEVLEQHLRNHLGDLDPAAMAFLRDRLEWVEIAAGETLMIEGEPGDSIFLSISGRLRAYVKDENGVERMVREMARGQIIGEMSMYTGEPRTATVVAVRDSVLVRLTRSDFTTLMTTSPSISIALTRQIIKRLQSAQTRSDIPRPITIGVLPITAGIQAFDFCCRLAGHLQEAGRVQVVDARRIDRELNQPALTQTDCGDARANNQIALHLDSIEAANDYVLLVGDTEATAWTQRCSQRCDEILLLAAAEHPPQLHDTEVQFLIHRRGRTEATESLVLLHDSNARCPSGTRRWLTRRPVSTHYHIRPAEDRDLARLARFLSGRAIGLVLAGGGARGLAHLGVYRALRERHIEIDCVGGTSIGSVMAGYVASDQAIPDIIKTARDAFGLNPTGDFNLFPMISLIKGRRLRSVIHKVIDQLFGAQVDIEDLWKSYYCIASNYSLAREQVIRTGDLSHALRASIAIPGALPPVIDDGDLLCDGGTFNNFPVDVMRGMRGIGKVIGVDLGVSKRRRIDFDEVPSGWSLLLDRLRSRRRRRFRLPSLMAYLVNVTILYSASRQRANRSLTDLYFNPPLDGVGMLAWGKFDDVVSQGHAHGLQVLDAMSPEELRMYATRPAD